MSSPCPVVRGSEPSRRRCVRQLDGSAVHMLPLEYHGNPVESRGSLVTMDWGYDICAAISAASGLHTEMHHIDDLSMGIRAKHIEVRVSRKTGLPALEE